MSEIQIITERLKIIPKTSEYAEEIFREYTYPVTQYMNYGPPESVESLKERLKEKNKEDLSFVVLNKENKEFLGCFSLENIQQKNPEMGGWLKESAQGRGYGKEAVLAIKKWADKNLSYEYILWPCAVKNVPSCKLAEFLGGMIKRTYEKTNQQEKNLQFYDYWIIKK